MTITWGDVLGLASLAGFVTGLAAAVLAWRWDGLWFGAASLLLSAGCAAFALWRLSVWF